MNINYEGLIRQLMTGDRTTMKIAADVIRDLLSDLATTRTALAAAEKDAERYRWLRVQAPNAGDLSQLWVARGLGREWLWNTGVDEAIDAARAEDRQEKV
jgi:hypothetical protein